MTNFRDAAQEQRQGGNKKKSRTKLKRTTVASALPLGLQQVAHCTSCWNQADISPGARQQTTIKQSTSDWDQHQSRRRPCMIADWRGIQGEARPPSRKQQTEPAVDLKSHSWSSGNKQHKLHRYSQNRGRGASLRTWTKAAGSLCNRTKKKKKAALELFWYQNRCQKKSCWCKRPPPSSVTAPPEPSHLCGSLWLGGPFWCCPPTPPQIPARLSDLAGRRRRPSPASLCSSWRSAAWNGESCFREDVHRPERSFLKGGGGGSGAHKVTMSALALSTAMVMGSFWFLSLAL